MSPTPQLKVQGGWFAAGAPLLQAMESVSDGAFKLFVYLCLKADRCTGELTVSPTQLAPALRKSRRSLFTYLGELQSRGLVQLSLARNQHERTHIQISEAFWPYQRFPRPGARSGRIPIPRSGGLSAARCPWRSVLLLPGRSAAGRSPLPPGPVLAADRAGPASRLRPQARRLAQRPHRWTDHFPELLRTSNPGSETTICLRSILGLSQESPEDSEATMETTLC